MYTAAGLFLYSIRYTRPRQLVARLLLIAKRKFLARFASAALKRRVALADAALPLQGHPLLPLFPPRRQLVAGTAPLTVRFLNVERNIALPLDWRPADLRVGTRLWLLNLHYMEFLEGLDDAQCFAYMRDWIARNLPYAPGYWLDNWNSFSLSIRIVVWMQQLAARGTTALAEDDRQSILRSLVAQARFLHSNIESDIGGNHIIKNIKALLWAGRFFDGAEARDWHRAGCRLLERELAEQVLPDGMHYELSHAYHAQVFADLLECYAALHDGALRQALGAALDRMARCQQDLTHPDGKCSLFNDAGLDMAYSTRECLAVHAALRGGRSAPQARIDYPSAGYFGLRSGDELILLDCGALAPDFLPAHGHGDALAFEWSIGDRRIVIDAGVYEYNDGPLRAASRATKTHNTVTLDDLDQSQFWKAFRVGRRARIVQRSVQWQDGGLRLEGMHDGYAHLPGGPRHRRTFAVAPGNIRIDDEIVGGSGQIATARLLLHPSCRVERKGPREVVLAIDTLRVRVAASADIDATPAECFLNFGVRQPTTQLVIRYGAAPVAGRIELGRLGD